MKNNEVFWVSEPTHKKLIPHNIFSDLSKWSPISGLAEVKNDNPYHHCGSFVRHVAIIYYSEANRETEDYVYGWIYFGDTEVVTGIERNGTIKEMDGEYQPLSNFKAIDNAMGYIKDLFYRDNIEEKNIIVCPM